jgi:hypothetical protein
MDAEVSVTDGEHIDTATVDATTTASGDTYEDAYASTDAYGDVTAAGGMDTDTQSFSMALSVGVAIERLRRR